MLNIYRPYTCEIEKNTFPIAPSRYWNVYTFIYARYSLPQTSIYKCSLQANPLFNLLFDGVFLITKNKKQIRKRTK